MSPYSFVQLISSWVRVAISVRESRGFLVDHWKNLWTGNTWQKNYSDPIIIIFWSMKQVGSNNCGTSFSASHQRLVHLHPSQWWQRLWTCPATLSEAPGPRSWSPFLSLISWQWHFEGLETFWSGSISQGGCHPGSDSSVHWTWQPPVIWLPELQRDFLIGNSKHKTRLTSLGPMADLLLVSGTSAPSELVARQRTKAKRRTRVLIMAFPFKDWRQISRSRGLLYNAFQLPIF